MEALIQRRCEPCRGDMPPFGPNEIAQYHPEVPEWTVENGNRLRRTYRFKDFATALKFLDRIGVLAEEEDHHPDLYLAWGRVEVILWTHKIGGLSQNDFILAAKTDLLAMTAEGIRVAKAPAGSVP